MDNKRSFLQTHITYFFQLYTSKDNVTFLLKQSSIHIKSSFSTNVAQSSSIKLDRNNYIIWKSQLLPVLRGHDLEGYVDGTHKCPSRIISNSSSEENSSQATVKPTYSVQIKWDQLLLSWILSTLTKGVLAQVVGCVSSRDVWKTLENMFASQSKARIMQLRLHLQTTKKATLQWLNIFKR